MAASVAAVLRIGAHIFSGNSCSSQICSARTFSVCLSSSSKRKEKRSGNGSMVALVPSIDHAQSRETTRRTLLMPSHSFQRSFRASSKVKSATGPSATAADAVSSSIPEADSGASTVSSSAAPTMDSTRDAADADSSVSTVSSSAAPSADSIRDAADTLDIRVGRILKAWRHPEADSLYVEEVDIGEPEPRTICSGLVKYIPLDDLQEANVVVLANLKPRNMRGIKSNGMLLAASDSSHENVELLVPPEGSILGERIWFGSEDEKNNTAAASPNQIQKKKIWELVQPHLKTDDSCVGFLGVHPMRTTTGVVTCKSLQNGNIA